MVIFEKNREQLQAVLAAVQQALEEWGMQMSILKTKSMHPGRTESPEQPLHISEHEIEQVTKFKCLGSIQSSDLSTRAEISNRIASAANAWLKLSQSYVWDDSHISRGIKCTLYKLIVQSTLLYASETWALPMQQLHRLEVFQMKCLKQICKVSLNDRINNDVILGWCNLQKSQALSATGD